MLINDLPIPEEYKVFLEKLGYYRLYPPQEDAIRKGVLDGKNLVVATPTASGKTFIALLSSIKKFVEEKGKIIYLVPLKALANEKYKEFKSLEKVMFNNRKIKVIISTSDYDDPGEKLKRADIIIATYEKMDSLLRHSPSWMNNISLIIIDEIHYIHSIDRGPTLELLITRLIDDLPDAQFLALSATIENTTDFEDWLNTKVIMSQWRPVPLKEGVFIDYSIIFMDGSVYDVANLYGNPSVDLALDTIKEDGQALIFVQRRRDAVSASKKIADAIRYLEIEKIEIEKCRKIAEKILNATETTELSRTLSQVVSYGVAFHHAGLAYEHRAIIEENFRKGIIKVITATPTLAAGVNLPARRVIISSLYRYELGFREPISVFEYKQMAGRAGRPLYDEYGEAIVITRTPEEADYIMDVYLQGKPEALRSRLLEGGSMDMHILGLLASKRGLFKREIEDFFDKTLCAVQRGSRRIYKEITGGLMYLNEKKLIVDRKGKYYPTEFGRRVAELYILPSTAVQIKEFVENYHHKENSDLTLLYVILSTPDAALAPYYSRERRKIEEHLSILSEEIGDVLWNPDNYVYTISHQLQIWKTVFVLYDWIQEVSEDNISRKWRVEPGDLQVIRGTSEWILYSAGQISKLFGYRGLYEQFDTLTRRVHYGVKIELLNLVGLEGIGRIRARNLYNAGYKTLIHLKKAKIEDLIKIPGIGETLAKRLVS
jgi:helicase